MPYVKQMFFENVEKMLDMRWSYYRMELNKLTEKEQSEWIERNIAPKGSRIQTDWNAYEICVQTVEAFGCWWKRSKYGKHVIGIA